MQSAGRLRPHVPILAMLALFLGLLLLAVFQTAGQANAVEAERSRAAVSTAMTALAERTTGTTNDNANWDDAVVALYRAQPDFGLAERTWARGTADHLNYDEVHIVDQRGRTLWSAVDGSSIAPRAFGPAVLQLTQHVDPRTKAAAGLLRLGGRAGDDVAMVGLGLIVPRTTALGRLVPDAGPFRLIMVRRVTDRLLADIGRGLALDDLRVDGASANREVLAVAGPNGMPAFTLTWVARSPGNEALIRAAPALLVALLVFLGICALIVRDTLSSVKKLARQAVTDSLSGLPNRRALRRALDQACRAQGAVALALIDLDGFKGINDNYGHAVGDRLIRAVGQVLRALARDGAIVARIGGDEFAVLTSGEGARIRLDRMSLRILERLGSPFRIDERTLVIGASIGYAYADVGEPSDPVELLRRADVAMYAAKRAGRMRITRFDATLDARQAAKHRIESELRAAIVTNDFAVVYQPLMAADRTTVTGVEALLRWTSPTLGIVPPEQFVPIAEETGLIDRIGLFVLDRACRDAVGWGDLRLAVNVSAAQLRNPDFPAQLGDVLRTTGFSPARLEVEITETYLVREADAARTVLDELRALGVTVSLDDFGTGFASIGFLRQFTFDKLKIDRSLVADAEHSASARAMVAASVAVARALNMTVTAEGIETIGQADVMRIVGCDELQGWLFSHAESAAEITSRMLIRPVAPGAGRAPPRRAGR